MLDLLGELEDKDRLRNQILGGYVTRMLEPPPIFSSEHLKSNCMFVEFKLIYGTDRSYKRRLTTGSVVAFVPDNLKLRDFYEFKGNLSSAGLNYSRVLTMMNFAKLGMKGTPKGYVWEVVPVNVSDLELTNLTKSLKDEVLAFAEAPLSFTSEKTAHLLEPKSEEKDSSKVYFDLTSLREVRIVRNKPTKNKELFEKENNYLIDEEYEVLREGLRYSKLAINLTEFENDLILLKYIQWLVDGNIKVVNNLSEISEEDSQVVIVTDKQIDGIPYIELRRGVVNIWEV